MAPAVTRSFQCNKNTTVSLTSNVMYRGLLQFYQWVPTSSKMGKMEVRWHQKCCVKIFFSSDTVRQKDFGLLRKIELKISVNACSGDVINILPGTQT
jgi:hypothetical protein